MKRENHFTKEFIHCHGLKSPTHFYLHFKYFSQNAIQVKQSLFQPSYHHLSNEQ